MYLRHFGLEHKPFSITPDPRFLFLSERYREALAHLLFGVGEGGGFVLLTGEVGTGKTTLCRGLLEQLPDNVDAALVINPKIGARELLETLCDELHVPRPAGEALSAKALVDLLNRYLLDAHAAGRRTVLIIDEAQNLDRDTLEQVRLLTNLETATEKLLQIILIGQPELRDLLARQDLRQLGQRITARYHLEPMTRGEVATYIDHRLRLAGADGQLFSAAAQRRVFSVSRGIPRLVNTVCDRALLGAYARGRPRIDAATIGRSAREVLSGSGSGSWRPLWLGAASLGLLAAAWGTTRLVDLGTAFDSPPPSIESARVATPAAVTPEPPEADLPGAPDTPADDVPEKVATAPTPPAGDSVPDQEDAPLPLAGTDRETALRRLAALWGITLPASGTACDDLVQHGLACYDGRSSWATLRLLDRPALLALPDAGGTPRYVVLEALAGDQPRLATEGEAHNVTLAALGNRWFGDYTVLWKPPPGQRLLRPGQRAPLVTWLRDRLDTFDGTPSVFSDAQQYDAALEQRVIRYQTAHGLAPDGLVGARTLLQLASPDTPGPRLQSTDSG
jgi:general secretion pathway protein A